MAAFVCIFYTCLILFTGFSFYSNSPVLRSASGTPLPPDHSVRGWVFQCTCHPPVWVSFRNWKPYQQVADKTFKGNMKLVSVIVEQKYRGSSFNDSMWTTNHSLRTAFSNELRLSFRALLFSSTLEKMTQQSNGEKKKYEKWEGTWFKSDLETSFPKRQTSKRYSCWQWGKMKKKLLYVCILRQYLASKFHTEYIRLFV